KSLSPGQYTSLIAFLMRYSGMPAGSTALPTDRGQLAGITFGNAPAGTAVARAAPAAGRAPGFGAAPARASVPRRGPDTEWTTYGGNLASQRYSPADQITKENFNQ